jgi:uncharacterized Zn-binding protein involved in type VI secretion
MAVVCRVGDLIETGGVIIDGATTVTVGGQLVALINSHINPHDCCSQSGNSTSVGTPCSLHCSAIIITGSPTVTCEGRQVAFVSSLCSCSHRVITGDDTVTVQG